MKIKSFNPFSDYLQSLGTNDAQRTSHKKPQGIAAVYKKRKAFEKLMQGIEMFQKREKTIAQIETDLQIVDVNLWLQIDVLRIFYINKIYAETINGPWDNEQEFYNAFVGSNLEKPDPNQARSILKATHSFKEIYAYLPLDSGGIVLESSKCMSYISAEPKPNHLILPLIMNLLTPRLRLFF